MSDAQGNPYEWRPQLARWSKMLESSGRVVNGLEEVAAEMRAAHERCSEPSLEHNPEQLALGLRLVEKYVDRDAAPPGDYNAITYALSRVYSLLDEMGIEHVAVRTLVEDNRVAKLQPPDLGGGYPWRRAESHVAERNDNGTALITIWTRSGS